MNWWCSLTDFWVFFKRSKYIYKLFSWKFFLFASRDWSYVFFFLCKCGPWCCIYNSIPIICDASSQDKVYLFAAYTQSLLYLPQLKKNQQSFFFLFLTLRCKIYCSVHDYLEIFWRSTLFSFTYKLILVSLCSVGT